MRFAVRVPPRVPLLPFWLRASVTGALLPVPEEIVAPLPSCRVTTVEKAELAPMLDGGSVVKTSVPVTVVAGLLVALVMFDVVVEAPMV